MRCLVMVLTLYFFWATCGFATTENIIANFNSSNGANPQGPLILDSVGNVYGITQNGGANGFGTVYQLVNSGSTWTLNVLHSFGGGSTDVCHPVANGLVLDSSGNLFGTAVGCGVNNRGGVFELSKSGSTWTEKLLYSFLGESDGAYPQSGLAIDSKGVLYGTTYQGGGGGCINGCGTVFTLTKKGGTWTEKVIHFFKFNGTDGSLPFAPVTLDGSGNLYGTTQAGGGFQYGTVFKLVRQKKGGWKESILHYFYGVDGCYPFSGVILDASGNLYGTTLNCGSSGYGTVYQLKRSGKKYINNVILNFNGSNGSFPYDFGIVAMDSSGNVYGTAYQGGAYGLGTLFRLSAGTWTYTDLHDFQNNGTDGYDSYSGIAIDSSGNLYGATNIGGSAALGTVYQITP